MIRIRLTRKGRKKAPFYKIIAIEKSRKREGKPLEVLGYWNPAKDEKVFDKKAIEEWVKKGAQMSAKVKELTS